MSDSEFLNNTLDLGTQARFTYAYTDTPGYADTDVLNELYDHFGVIVIQDTVNVTVSLPTAGLGTNTLNYLRQITNHYDASQELTVELSSGRTLVLQAGETCYVFWTGTEWLAHPSDVESRRDFQGRVEKPTVSSYMIINGGRFTFFLDKIYLNASSGTGEVAVLKNGTTVTSSNITVSSGTESQYTFNPRVEIEPSDTVSLQFSNLTGLGGVHYRIDLNESS